MKREHGDNGPRWSAPSAGELVWEDFEDDHVIYQHTSGQTHYLNGAGAVILHFLAGREATTHAVVAAVCQHTGARVDAELAAQITQTLEHFEVLGLVTRSPAATPASC